MERGPIAEKKRSDHVLRKRQLIFSVAGMVTVWIFMLWTPLHIKHFKDIESALYAGMSIAGMLTMNLLMILLQLQNAQSDEKNRLYFALVFMTYLDLVEHALYYCFLGLETFTLLVKILIPLQYLYAPFLCVTYWFYHKHVLYGTKAKWRRRDGIVLIGFIADAASIFFSIFFGYYFRIHADASYELGPAYSLAFVYPLGVLLGCLIECAANNIKQSVKRVMIAFCILLMGSSFISFGSDNTIIVKLSTIIILYLIYGIVQLRQARENEKNREEMTQMKIEAMTMQINPHFIYNTLGSIDCLFEEDVESGHELLREFSDYLRANYRFSKGFHMISCREELERLGTYLKIEQVRFPNLRIRKDVETDRFELPALSLQPLVENAIEHGICRRKKSAGTVNIMIREKANAYLIRIEDDGVGFSGEVSDGKDHVGIENVRKRLQLLCNGTLEIASTIDVGTTCTIRIPKGQTL